MSRRENLKLLVKFGIMSGIICSLIVGFRGTGRQNLAAGIGTTPSQGRISVPVTVKQLDFVNGVVPVYLNCEETVLIVPDTLDRVPCTIRNNSRKNIRALVLGESITVENNGTTSTELGYVTIDTFIHPDFHTESNTGINQKAEPQFPSATETYSGIITRVQVQIDYVEFNNRETLGPNMAGGDILFGMRDGAAKYKSWLVKEYEIKGKSVDALIRLIEEAPITVDLGIRTASQEQGAVIYRNWLRKIYQTKGAEQLRKQLNYSGSAIDQ
jgi:hypothetical protein